jgi:hypothetical protein
LIEAGGFLRMGSGWDDDGSIKIANGIEWHWNIYPLYVCVFVVVVVRGWASDEVNRCAARVYFYSESIVRSFPRLVNEWVASGIRLWSCTAAQTISLTMMIKIGSVHCLSSLMSAHPREARYRVAINNCLVSGPLLWVYSVAYFSGLVTK